MELGITTSEDAVDENVLRDAILDVATSLSHDPEKLADAIVLILEGTGVVVKKPKRSLLNAHGTLLCEIAKTPSATLRSLGNRLGWSESRTQKVASQLVSSGLLARTRSGKGVKYKFARNEVFKHPDIERVISLLIATSGDTPKVAGDSTTERLDGNP
jgi:hypothetical protein